MEHAKRNKKEPLFQKYIMPDKTLLEIMREKREKTFLFEFIESTSLYKMMFPSSKIEEECVNNMIHTSLEKEYRNTR